MVTEEEKYEKDFGPLAEHVRHLPCLVCAKDGWSDPAHVRSRGASAGAWLESGDGNLVPLCRRHHEEQHRIGILSFQERYSVDLAAKARVIGLAFLERPDGHLAPF